MIGTAKDYWKDWVEEEQVKTVKTYYKPEDAGESSARMCLAATREAVVCPRVCVMVWRTLNTS